MRREDELNYSEGPTGESYINHIISGYALGPDGVIYDARINGPKDVLDLFGNDYTYIGQATYYTNSKGVFGFGDSGGNFISVNGSEPTITASRTNNSSTYGQNIAAEAILHTDVSIDNRLYKYGAPVGSKDFVDCSLFVMEVVRKITGNTDKNFPRTAKEQFSYLISHGAVSINDIDDLEVGDIVFFDRSKGKGTGYHAGILTSKKPPRVTSAGTRNYKSKSIKEEDLTPNGQIIYWGQPFVGAARIK